MSKGRGRAGAATALVLCLVLLHYEVAQATVYNVGGASGWTFKMTSWPDAKRFKAGDVLVFKYDPSLHNVVKVNKRGYRSCHTPRGSKVYQTGNDRITLARGRNFFICNFPGHCEAQMKIAVTAT
ncbi:basic blue protein-like [Apium graveolens]|uniref:basic blue protein-like n=1 Tax=Apium graveolens TaxID=4045 RepID=UPI003D78D7E9